MSEQMMTRAAGPMSYGDARLLEIATSTRKIAFWVRLWSILAVVGMGLTVLLWLVVSIASASHSSSAVSSYSSSYASSSSGPSGIVMLLIGIAMLVVVAVVSGMAYLAVRGPATSRPAAADAGQGRAPRAT
ncbi:hypothetical protein LQ327_25340 [Actinomycetospora endophytica]|uniref:Transmembrane protein n=1 Tax=Actinomycetospora endophytica TaxID=2291215 RepID=A0ABS8PGS3_9PSEU|nr:hypothetical protein [Actinomycetospora endophytica]MCD2196700.1 hypothetical protein [Actinomycetospora endophytica]